MKKLLFVFLVMLAAIPAMAQDLPITETPVIQITEYQDGYTVVVEGEGLLTVELSRDLYGEDWQSQELIGSGQDYGSFQYAIQRPPAGDGFVCYVKAIAQEDGKEPSEVAILEFTVAGYFVMPTPVINFVEEEDGLYIYVEGQEVLTVYVSVNDVGSYVYDLPYFVPRTNEHQYIYVDATSNGLGGLGVLPAGVTESYVLTAATLPPGPIVTPSPHFWVEEEEEYVIIHADPGDDPLGLYGEMAVYLYIQGQQVENPFVVWRTYEEQDLDISAYAVSLTHQEAEPSETVPFVYIIAPLPEVPVEETAAPTVSGTYTENGYLIDLYETEPSTIYYRIGINYEYNGFIFGDWMAYTGQMAFNYPGFYRIEAYAIADGKLQSALIAYEFVVTEPTPSYIYDFEEDGVFYKITAEGKVSVCSETTDYNSYSGEVVIPATVTHNGVTYMVTGIYEDAFRGCSGLTGVTIGAYVTAIGKRAFKNCTSLTSVTLGDYVITLGEEAFSGCSSLTSVTLGSGLASIGAKAFQGCDALTSVTCKAATPPVMASSNCLACYSTATLHVYPAVLDSYQSTNYWNQFTTIVAEDKVAPAVGDTNGDGKLSITDVTSLIELLLKM